MNMFQTLMIQRKKDTSCSLHAWRTDDRLGTGSLYFLDTCGRQRRFYCSISECKASKKNVDDGMRLGKKVIETLGQISGDVPLLHKPENHVEDYHDVKKKQ